MPGWVRHTPAPTPPHTHNLPYSLSLCYSPAPRSCRTSAPGGGGHLTLGPLWFLAPMVGHSPASNERPTCVFHSQVTKYRLKDATAPSRYVGRYSHEPELAAQIDALKSSQKPLHQKGAVCEFGVLEAVLDRVFCEPACCREGAPALVTEALGNPLAARKLTAEVLLETYGVPAVQFCHADACAFGYNALVGSSGGAGASAGTAPPRSALLVGVGHGHCSVLPVVGGRVLFDQGCRVPVGGQHCTKTVQHFAYLGRLPSRLFVPAVAEAFKERFCGFAEAGLPGGPLPPDLAGLAGLDHIRSVCGEALFSPSLLGHKHAGLGECVGRVWGQLGEDERRAIQEGGLFLTGNGSRLHGFADRLQAALAPELPLGSPPIPVTLAGDPGLDAWSGARVMSEWIFEDEALYISRDQLAECGAEHLLARESALLRIHDLIPA